MRIHHLRPAPGAKKARTRVGRGRAGTRGKTAGRGTKGYLARNSKRLGFEGGQLPLLRRVPKKRGFTSRDRERWSVVNVERLSERFKAGETVTPEAMAERGLVRKRLPVKVLGAGEISHALTIQAHAVSKSAREKIEQAGGSVEVL